jgi:hypothetical protein
MRTRAWPACLALAVVAGCSTNPTNDPPQIAIVAPLGGDHLTAATNVVAAVSDDQGIARVRFTLDDTVLLDDYVSPWQAAIPVGEWASGRPVVLGATVWDSDGIARSAVPVTITIDPSLQTVPQVLAFEPASGVDPPVLAARWLSFPAATGYTVQLSRGEGFASLISETAVADTALITDVASEGVTYARVRAALNGEPSDWSRPQRFAGVTTLLTVVPLLASQAGLEVAVRPSGEIAVVSGPRDDLAIGPVTSELITLEDDGAVAARAALPTFASLWMADPYLYLCGDGWVACHGLDDGAQVWRVETSGMLPSAVGSGGAGLPLLVAGRDLQEDAMSSLTIVTLAPDDGAEIQRATVELEADLTVTQVWGLAGVCVVAGDIAAGGVWARGIDVAQGRELWHLRLGTGDRFQLRDAVPVGDNLILVGNAATRGAWAAAITADGRPRWLTRESLWAELAGAAPEVDGGVLVAGFARGDGGSANLVYGELTSAGAWRWQQNRAYTLNARGLAVTQAADGSVVVMGTALPAGGDWDLLLQRTDDRGDLN